MLPLEGTTVVALEQAVAAPFASRQLADLGARVIKVERPGVGDFARGYDTTVRGLSSHFVWLNRGKESLTLDLKRPEARLVLSRLVERADVFVQNLAPLSADPMHQRRPMTCLYKAKSGCLPSPALNTRLPKWEFRSRISRAVCMHTPEFSRHCFSANAPVKGPHS